MIARSRVIFHKAEVTAAYNGGTIRRRFDLTPILLEIREKPIKASLDGCFQQLLGTAHPELLLDPDTKWLSTVLMLTRS